MKIMKIILAILIPVAAVCGIFTLVYPIITPLEGVEALDFSQLFESLLEAFKDFSAFQEKFGFPIYVMLAAMGVGALLFVLWIVFAIVKRHFLGILFGFIAALVLEVAALGVFVNMSYDFAATALEVENTMYGLMTYVALGAIVLFVAAFVLHVIIMFKANKAKKLAKAEAKAKEAEAEQQEDEIDYSDLPPVLTEASHPARKPELLKHKVDHIERGENHVLKGHYVRDDEIEVILAASQYRHEDEIPESILEYLDKKHRAEEEGLDLAMFDPDFEKNKEIYTDDELRIMEALRNSRNEVEEEDVDLPMFDPNFVPGEDVEEEEPLSEEELEVVKAMSNYEPSAQHFGCKDDEYVDLPFFREHEEVEEPVEYVEEIIRVAEPEEAKKEEVKEKEPVEEEVHAPKLASSKPVHISKNSEGKYQLKQVGAKKPLAVFDSEDEAVKFALALKKVNGVALRLHDEEGKIRSL